MRRALALVVLLSIAAPVAAQPRARSGSRFQQPAAEQRVETESVSDGDRARLRGDDDDGPPSDLEERLYLSERPDAIGAAAREWHDQQLETLLRDREQLARERRDHPDKLRRQRGVGGELEQGLEVVGWVRVPTPLT